MVVKMKSGDILKTFFGFHLDFTYRTTAFREGLRDEQKLTLSMKKGKKRVLVKGVLHIHYEYASGYDKYYLDYEFRPTNVAKLEGLLNT